MVSKSTLDWDNPIRNEATEAAWKNPKWNSASFLGQQNLIDDEVMRIGKNKALLFNQIESLLNNKTDAEQRFIGTPISEYTETDHKLGALNPDLLAMSKKYDDLVSQIGESNNNISNLSNAKAEMMAAVNDQKSAVNKSADSAKSGTALSKAIQIGDAQGTAGMQGATAGQLNKAQNEISNQFAPKFADIEATRQAGLGTAAQLQQGIPTALSSINEQNAAANYNNSLARAASSTAKSNSSSKILNPIQDKNIVKPTSTVSGPGSWKINPTTQKYEWVPLSTTVKQIANPLTNLGIGLGF